MATTDDPLVGERRRQRLVGLGTIAILGLVSAQLDHRALLLTPEGAAAFPAITAAPPTAAGIALASLGDDGPFGAARGRRRPAGASAFFTRPGTIAGVGQTPGGAANLAPAAAGQAAPAQGLATNVAAPGAGSTQSGGGGGGGASSPAIGGGGGGGTAAVVGGGPGVVGAVPEPATWMIMILGIGGIGCFLRRRRERGTVADASWSTLRA